MHGPRYLRKDKPTYICWWRGFIINTKGINSPPKILAYCGKYNARNLPIEFGKIGADINYVELFMVHGASDEEKKNLNINISLRHFPRHLNEKIPREIQYEIEKTYDQVRDFYKGLINNLIQTGFGEIIK